VNNLTESTSESVGIISDAVGNQLSDGGSDTLDSDR